MREEEDEEDSEMKALFGFGDFDTSKFKDHSATSVEAVHKSKSVQSQYR